MKRKIKFRFNRHLARILTSLDNLNATFEQKKAVIKGIDYLEQDILEILKSTLQGK